MGWGALYSVIIFRAGVARIQAYHVVVRTIASYVFQDFARSLRFARFHRGGAVTSISVLAPRVGLFYSVLFYSVLLMPAVDGCKPCCLWCAVAVQHRACSHSTPCLRAMCS